MEDLLMPRRYVLGVFVFWLAAVAAVATTAQQPVELKWKFGPNDKLTLETVSHLKQSIKAGGQEMKQELDVTTLSSYTVTKKDQDGTVLEQKIESQKATAPGGATPAAAGLLAQMQGSTLRITLDAKMKVAKLEGYDDMIKKVAGDDPSAKRSVQAMIPEETLRRSVEEAFAFLPDEPVRQGQKWERPLTITLGPLGMLTVKHVYSYEGPVSVQGRTLHKMTDAPTVTYAPPPGSAGVLPFQITKGEVKTEQASGTLLFDTTAGKLVRSEMTMKLKGTLTIVMNNQESTLDLDQEHRIEIRQVDGAK
jgi:hypothetical protein